MHNSIKKLFFIILALDCFLLWTAPLSSAFEKSTDKTLILYYSLTGNTRACCKAMKQSLNADILEIKDLRKRATSGFAYFKTAIGSLLGRHTKIEPEHPDLAPYQHIIIGSPIWTGKLSMAIRTLIKKNRFDGKKVILFTTTNAFEKEKYKQKSKNLVRKAGGNVVGYFQVAVKKKVNGEKADKSKEQIREEALKFVPDIQKAFGLLP